MNIIKRNLNIFVMCMSLSIATAGTAASYVDMGDVTGVKGTVEAISNAANRVLSEKDDLFEGETIKTGDKGVLSATLSDGGTLQIPPNSQLEISKFLLNSDAPEGKLKVIKGAFRLTSGKLNKMPGGKFSIETPMATLGIRGTDFYLNQQSDELTISLIDNGKIDVSDINGKEFTIDEPMTTIVIKEGQELQKRKFSMSELEKITKTLDSTSSNWLLQIIVLSIVLGYLGLMVVYNIRKKE